MKTKIFLDSGDAEETKKILTILGFLDGQTTNPSLVAKNPHIQKLKAEGALDDETIWEEYNKVALAIHGVIPAGSISVEVYADATTTRESMLEQAQKLAEWFPEISVKLPITKIGLSVAKELVVEGVNVNMTLCFSQEQAAAVHMATQGAKKGQVYISPFIGRLDDIGLNGLDLVKNILQMYRAWGSHVEVLSASIRNLDHLYYCLQNETDIITAPLGILAEWAGKNPSEYTVAPSDKKSIPFLELPQQDWELYDIHHDLTEKGIEKFSADWKSLFVK